MSDPTSGWEPAIKLDLETASAAAFQNVQDAFRDWSKSHPLSPVGLSNGWHIITPEIAERLLRNNRGNRKVSFRTVSKYAAAMTTGQWKRTGQPILINQDGQVEDCQHRAWASYLSGASFPSYVVADVPVEDDLFVYLDDSRPRNAADALYTAGNNGFSAIIASAIKLAFKYDNNALSILKHINIRDMTNIEVLNYARQNPGLNQATHSLMTNYQRAAAVIGNKGVAAFFAWKALTAHGHDALHDFMIPLGTGANLNEDDPILALRNRLIGDGSDDKDLREGHRLALVIKGFNLHIADQKVTKRGLYVRDNEKYPRIDAPGAEAPLAAAA